MAVVAEAVAAPVQVLLVVVVQQRRTGTPNLTLCLQLYHRSWQQQQGRLSALSSRLTMCLSTGLCLV